jgi:hypothetical protein
MPQEHGIFDFEQIPEEKRSLVLQKTAETQWLLKRSADDIFRIGKNLLELKAILPHGMYEKLVRTQFPLSLRSAQNFTYISKKIGQKSASNALLDGWGVNDLLELASAPDDFIFLISEIQSRTYCYQW